MKGFIGFFVALSLMIGMSAPLFASECADLAAKVEETIASSQASDDKKEQASTLLDEGTAACESGDEAKGVTILNQALGLLN